jgi:hypothetical protein
MGYNATVVILLDGLHAIAEDKEFGKKLSDAVLATTSNRDTHRLNRTLYAGNGNVGEVVEVHHADETVVVSVGANMGVKMATTYYTRNHHLLKTQIDIVGQLADQLGFSLRKKPKTRKRK